MGYMVRWPCRYLTDDWLGTIAISIVGMAFTRQGADVAMEIISHLLIRWAGVAIFATETLLEMKNTI